jgi:hypothetical protein
MNLTITVTEAEMNVIVNALAQAPYGVVYELLPKLEAQCKAQMGPPQQPAPPGNGAAETQ